MALCKYLEEGLATESSPRTGVFLMLPWGGLEGPVAACVGMTRMETSSPDVIEVEFMTSAAELKVVK